MKTVEFTLTPFNLGSGKVIQACRNVFGERLARWAKCAQPVTVTCSSDRFVQFLIERDRVGATNDWKSIHAKFVAPAPPAPIRESFN
jgi:hypothetical protein